MYIYVRPVNLINMKHCSYLIVRVEYLMNVARFLTDIFFNISVIFYEYKNLVFPVFFFQMDEMILQLSIRLGLVEE